MAKCRYKGRLFVQLAVQRINKCKARMKKWEKWFLLSKFGGGRRPQFRLQQSARPYSSDARPRLAVISRQAQRPNKLCGVPC
jgi:hypothetical protein